MTFVMVCTFEASKREPPIYKSIHEIFFTYCVCVKPFKMYTQSAEYNKGADQPAYTSRLISAFVIRLLESIISKLASSEISIFYLVSVAEETGLSLAFSENPEDRFSCDEARIVELKDSILACTSIYIPSLSARAAKALARLHMLVYTLAVHICN